MEDHDGGGRAAADYVRTHLDERAIAPPLMMFEVCQGEVFGTGSADVDVDGITDVLDADVL